MQSKSSVTYFIFIATLTLLFCLAITFDISPYLRGPSPYPPEWQWSYQFVNTLSRIYFPLAIIAILIGLFWVVETKQQFHKKHPLIFLAILIVLSFLLQLSLLFF